MQFLTTFLNEFKRKYEEYLTNDDTFALLKKIELENKKEFAQNVFLSKLITHKNGVEIVKEIKIKYKNIKGKRLKLLLLALQEIDLLPNTRIGKKFHECCKNEFEWSIGSYAAMNDYKFNEYTDKDELENMNQFLNSLIKTQ